MKLKHTRFFDYLTYFVAFVLLFNSSIAPITYAFADNTSGPNNVIGTDHPKSEGEVMTFKEAKINPDGKSMDVALRVEAKGYEDQDTGIDYVMVIDGSRSMDEKVSGSKTRMEFVKEAQKSFEDVNIDNNGNNRIATVLFGSTVDKCLSKDKGQDIYFVGNEEAAKNIEGTGNLDSKYLSKWIADRRNPYKSSYGFTYNDNKYHTNEYDKNTKYIGEYRDIDTNYYKDNGIGTNTQGGIHAATEIIMADNEAHPENKGRKKVVILLSDGMASHYPKFDVTELNKCTGISSEIGKKYGIKAMPGIWDEAKYAAWRFGNGNRGTENINLKPNKKTEVTPELRSVEYIPGEATLGLSGYKNPDKPEEGFNPLYNCIADGQMIAKATIKPKKDIDIGYNYHDVWFTDQNGNRFDDSIVFPCLVNYKDLKENNYKVNQQTLFNDEIDKDKLPNGVPKKLVKGKEYTFYYRRDTFGFKLDGDKLPVSSSYFYVKPPEKVMSLYSIFKVEDGNHWVYDNWHSGHWVTDYKNVTEIHDAFCGEGYFLDQDTAKTLFNSKDVEVELDGCMELQADLTPNKLKNIKFDYDTYDSVNDGSFTVASNYAVNNNNEDNKVTVEKYYDEDSGYYQFKHTGPTCSKPIYNTAYGLDNPENKDVLAGLQDYAKDSKSNTSYIKFGFNILDNVVEERRRLENLSNGPIDTEESANDSSVILCTVATGLDENKPADRKGIELLKTAASSKGDNGTYYYNCAARDLGKHLVSW